MIDDLSSAMVGQRLNDLDFSSVPIGTFVYDRFNGLYGEVNLTTDDHIWIQFKQSGGQQTVNKLHRRECGAIEVVDPDRGRAHLYGNFNAIVHRALSRLLGR